MLAVVTGDVLMFGYDVATKENYKISYRRGRDGENIIHSEKRFILVGIKERP